MPRGPSGERTMSDETAATDPCAALRREVFELEEAIVAARGFAAAAEALAEAAVLNNHPDVDGLTLGLAATTAATRRAIADVETRYARVFELMKVIAPRPERLPS